MTPDISLFVAKATLGLIIRIDNFMAVENGQNVWTLTADVTFPPGLSATGAQPVYASPVFTESPAVGDLTFQSSDPDGTTHYTATVTVDIKVGAKGIAWLTIDSLFGDLSDIVSCFIGA